MNPDDLFQKLHEQNMADFQARFEEDQERLQEQQEAARGTQGAYKANKANTGLSLGTISPCECKENVHCAFIACDNCEYKQDYFAAVVAAHFILTNPQPDIDPEPKA